MTKHKIEITNATESAPDESAHTRTTQPGIAPEPEMQEGLNGPEPVPLGALFVVRKFVPGTLPTIETAPLTHDEAKAKCQELNATQGDAPGTWYGVDHAPEAG